MLSRSLPKPQPILFAMLLVGACRSGAEPARPTPEVPAQEKEPSFECPPKNLAKFTCGSVSWYGENHAGRKTASGEAFDPAALTAAHRTFPFGSQLWVCNPSNGKTVQVRVNDRGPFGKGRILDLSQSAFAAIADLDKGKVKVCLRKVEP